jgi:hypothetical protein
VAMNVMLCVTRADKDLKPVNMTAAQGQFNQNAEPSLSHPTASSSFNP